MKTIQVTLTKYEQGETCLVEEHPIVNDPDYCEVVETKAELDYNYDGCHFLQRGKAKDTPKQELIEKLIPNVILATWLEEHCFDSFTDVGVEPPMVYDWEEDSHYKVNDIDNFVNNCRDDDCYKNIMQQLQEIAESEFSVEIIDKC